MEYSTTTASIGTRNTAGGRRVMRTPATTMPAPPATGTSRNTRKTPNAASLMPPPPRPSALTEPHRPQRLPRRRTLQLTGKGIGAGSDHRPVGALERQDHGVGLDPVTGLHLNLLRPGHHHSDLGAGPVDL